MSGDVGFVPGSLIEAASGVQDACDPFVESVSSLGDEVAGLIPGVNGSYVEPLTSSLESWGESLKVLFDDLGRLVEALVGVENSFGACESEIVASLVQAASGYVGDGGDSSGVDAFASELGGTGAFAGGGASGAASGWEPFEKVLGGTL